jgi:hypothetical protein
MRKGCAAVDTIEQVISEQNLAPSRIIVSFKSDSGQQIDVILINLLRNQK